MPLCTLLFTIARLFQQVGAKCIVHYAPALPGGSNGMARKYSIKAKQAAPLIDLTPLHDILQVAGGLSRQ